MLSNKVDFPLWTDKFQIKACNEALRTQVEPLVNSEGTGVCQGETAESDECDPCSKLYDDLFKKYSEFVSKSL